MREGSSLAERAVQALPAGVVLALAAFMVEREGGFALTVWSPIALILLALVATLAIFVGRVAAGTPRATRLAIACFAAFAAFAFATIGWATVRGDAWDGSNKAVLYLIAFVLLAVWPITAGALWPLLLGFSAVVAAEGVWTVERIVHSTDPSQFTIGTRLSEPLGYPNATGALYMILFWLMLGLATRPWLAAPFRGLAFGLAGLDAALNLLTESRGSIFTLPLVVIVYFVIVPGRLRSVAALALVALAFAPVARPVLDVYGTDPVRLPSKLSDAIAVALLSSALLAVAGWLFALGDTRWKPSRRTTRAAAGAVLAAVVVALAAITAVTTPWSRLDNAWHSFKYTNEPTGTASHFGGLGSARYDFWRVGLIEFERHPVLGIGMDNFVVPYVQQRHSQEQPNNPHSLLVRLLSESGVVGTLLFAGFLGLALFGGLRIAPGPERELARVLLVGFAVWLLHGLVDWLWEMPVLGLLGIGLLGLACALAPRPDVASRSPRLARWRWPLIAASGAAAVATAVSLALPWLSAREVQAAASGWTSDPAGAFTALRRAGSLDPLSDEPDLIAGAIASRLHRYTLMREQFADAVRRSPDDWYANLELAIAASLTGRQELAATSLARARQLNPRDELIRDVLKTFRSGGKVDSDAVDRAFAAGD